VELERIEGRPQKRVVQAYQEAGPGS
jgi:hypothetical protein